MKLMSKRGFTLLEVLLVVGLGSLIVINEVDQEQLKAEQIRAKAMASEIAQFQSALNSYVSYHRGAVTSSSVPPELQGVKRGVNWLKRSSDCAVGTSSFPNEFLPCDYLSYNDSKLGFSNLEFETFFNTVYDPDTGIGKVVAKTVLSDFSSGSATPWIRSGELASGLSGLTALIVSGDSILSTTTSVLSRSAYCLDAGGLYCSDPAFPVADYAKDKIVLYNSTTADNGIDLRIDGSNTMLGAVSFNPDISRDLREVRNVARLFGGSGEGVVIGDSGFYSAGLVPDEDLVVTDADMSVYGNLIARKNMVIERALEVDGFASFRGGLGVDGNLDVRNQLKSNNLTANTLQSTDIDVNGTIATDGFFNEITVHQLGVFEEIKASGAALLNRLDVYNESRLKAVEIAGNLDLISTNNSIRGVDSVIDQKDAANKRYVDQRIPDVSALKQTILQRAYPIGSVYSNYGNMGGSSTNCGNPASQIGFGSWTPVSGGRVLVTRNKGGGGLGTFAVGGENGAVTYSHSHTVDLTTRFGSGVYSNNSERFGSRRSTRGRAVVGTGRNEGSEKLESVNHPTGSTRVTSSTHTANILPPYRVICMWYRSA